MGGAPPQTCVEGHLPRGELTVNFSYILSSEVVLTIETHALDLMPPQSVSADSQFSSAEQVYFHHVWN